MIEKKLNPEIVVFAGPNGSGKTTITELLKPTYDYVNADEIKKHLKCTDLKAAQLAEEQRENFIKNDKNFSFETVLSTARNINLLARAKQKGYFIKSFFILTSDPAINVARVHLRYLSGGHDVPEEKIKSRYDKSLCLVSELLKVSDICNIYDNSIRPFRIFKKRKNMCYYDDRCVLWNLEDIRALTDVDNLEYKNLNL